ncbi:hypothetical protein CsSME_00013289 [Camellia sinensis var. sinensis]
MPLPLPSKNHFWVDPGYHGPNVFGPQFAWYYHGPIQTIFFPLSYIYIYIYIFKKTH